MIVWGFSYGLHSKNFAFDVTSKKFLILQSVDCYSASTHTNAAMCLKYSKILEGSRISFCYAQNHLTSKRRRRGVKARAVAKSLINTEHMCTYKEGAKKKVKKRFAPTVVFLLSEKRSRASPRCFPLLSYFDSRREE